MSSHRTTERRRVVFRPLWPAAWRGAWSRWSAFADWCRRLADAARVAEFVRIPSERVAEVVRLLAPARRHRSHRRKSLEQMLFSRRIFETLEQRAMLFGIAAYPDSYTAENTQTLNVAAPGVLANDTDYGGYQMTAHLSTGTSHGTFTLNRDGSLTYTPNACYIGSDSVTYYDTDQPETFRTP